MKKVRIVGYIDTKKTQVRAKRFKSYADSNHVAQTWLHVQDPTLYRQGFGKWVSHLDKCLNRGDYVEK